MTWEGVAGIVASVAAVIAGVRWLAAKIAHVAVRSERQDVLLFGDGTDEHLGLEKWQRMALERFDCMDRRMMHIETQVTPNGGNTPHLGDRVQRIENTLQTLIPEQRKDSDG